MSATEASSSWISRTAMSRSSVEAWPDDRRFCRNVVAESMSGTTERRRPRRSRLRAWIRLRREGLGSSMRASSSVSMRSPSRSRILVSCRHIASTRAWTRKGVPSERRASPRRSRCRTGSKISSGWLPTPMTQVSPARTSTFSKVSVFLAWARSRIMWTRPGKRSIAGRWSRCTKTSATIGWSGMTFPIACSTSDRVSVSISIHARRSARIHGPIASARAVAGSAAARIASVSRVVSSIPSGA